MNVYTNKRPSLVSVGGIHVKPNEVFSFPDETTIVTAEGPRTVGRADVEKALEATGKDGKLIHPLRRGPTPILVLGKDPAPEPTSPPPKVNTLADLGIPQALAQIKFCTSLDTLATWADDIRPEVQEAVRARAGELAPRR